MLSDAEAKITVKNVGKSIREVCTNSFLDFAMLVVFGGF